MQQEVSVNTVERGGEVYQDGEGALKLQEFPCSVVVGSGALVLHVVVESTQDVVDEEVDWVQGVVRSGRKPDWLADSMGSSRWVNLVATTRSASLQ